MTTQATDIPMLKLNDGHTLPAVGFGTYKLNGIAGSQAIEGALGNGYRLLDTAFNYENEGAVGAAARRSDVPREQIIVSSKLPGRHHAYAEALATIEESVYRTGLEHLDLYLIHWPNPKQGKYVEAWKALIEARRRGLVTSIGVSNFLPEHLQRLIDETGVTPAVNQIEMHPYFPQAEQHAWDAAHGIIDEAWSPLGRANSLLRDLAIQRIADAHRRSLVQVVLRWHVQLGVIPLPKATHAERQMQNLSLFDFELSPEEMAEITALGRPDGRTANQDPAEYEEF